MVSSHGDAPSVMAASNVIQLRELHEHFLGGFSYFTVRVREVVVLDGVEDLLPAGVGNERFECFECLHSNVVQIAVSKRRPSGFQVLQRCPDVRMSRVRDG